MPRLKKDRLQSLVESREGQPDMADIMVQLNRIIAAVKSTVPQEMWGEIVGKLDRPELEHSVPFDEDADDFEGEDDIFDPGEVRRGGRRVLTSAPSGLPPPREIGDRCRC